MRSTDCSSLVGSPVAIEPTKRFVSRTFQSAASRLMSWSRASKARERGLASRGNEVAQGRQAQQHRCWLGRKDSNLQPSDPESAALPLRHSPSKRSGPAAYSSQPLKCPFSPVLHTLSTPKVAWHRYTAYRPERSLLKASRARLRLGATGRLMAPGCSFGSEAGAARP